MKSKNACIKLLALPLMGWLLLVSGQLQAAAPQGPAPDFALKTSGGENTRLSEHRGEVVMINFWASWCAPCRQEMPLLEELYTQYQPLGFTILGVNVEEDSSKALSMLEDIPVSFPIMLDTRSTVSKLYNVVAMPTSILVDRDGNMRYLHHGYKPGYEEQYQQQVRELIRE
ncbi:thiol-disulfide isomerase/thioredoxin [Thiogranum longum]|uniref:Thiol-disulfide isomerase/thioredoxin n=1 Tax=Thiogranum longum TaxID=1537524 RepID=A0A4R1HCV7_9GAMM|nr:TlpA disulfide reductase family protein [Thiogranum longum]TCK17059.1 thiol-disulfide isomerase/thioredoxin [Thiogranum longum]